MKYRVEFTSENGQKRYLDFEGDDVDVAVSIIQELAEGETYKKSPYVHSGTGSKRDGDIVILRTKNGSQEYGSVALAQAAAAELPLEDGYDILSLEQPVGSRHTEVITHRPGFE